MTTDGRGGEGGVQPSVALVRSDATRADAANDPFDVLELAIVDDEQGRLRAPPPRTADEEIADIDRQRPGHPRQDIETDVHLAAFDLTDMFTAVADQFGESLLAQSVRAPQPSHVAADAEPDGSQVIWHAWRLLDTHDGRRHLV